MKSSELNTLNNFQTELQSITPTPIMNENAVTANMSSILESLIPSDKTEFIIVTPDNIEAIGVVNTENIELVSVESVLESIIESPEIPYMTYELTKVTEDFLEGIENYFGVIPKIYFVKLGSRGFLSINDKFFKLK